MLLIRKTRCGYCCCFLYQLLSLSASYNSTFFLEHLIGFGNLWFVWKAHLPAVEQFFDLVLNLRRGQLAVILGRCMARGEGGRKRVGRGREGGGKREGGRDGQRKLERRTYMYTVHITNRLQT